MARTADYEYEVKGYYEIDDYKLGAADVFYKGAIVNLGTDGLLKVAADVASERPVGIMKEQITSDGSTTKIGEVVVGRVWMPYTGAAQSDVGKKFYATADDTIATSAVNVTIPFGVAKNWKTNMLLIDTRAKV